MKANGYWLRQCHKCNEIFHSTTKHGKVCPTCSREACFRTQERERKVSHAGRIFQERMEKIKKFGALLA